MAKTFDDSQVIGITSKTLNDLFTNGGADCVAMYLKYAYHAKYQKTNTVYATVEFMAHGLDWGRDKARATKKKLTDLGFIEDKIGKDEEGKTKWFVRINGLLTKAKSKQVFGEYPTEFQESRYPTEKVQGGKSVDKCLKDNKSKCLKDNNFLEKKLSNSNGSNNESNARPLTSLESTQQLEDVKSIFDYAKKKLGYFDDELTPELEKSIAKILKRFTFKKVQQAIDKRSVNPKLNYWDIRWIFKNEDNFLRVLNLKSKDDTTFVDYDKPRYKSADDYTDLKGGV